MTDLTHMRLLIVDANDGARESLAQLLAQAGYGDIVSTGDLASAHHHCIAEGPDLVLLDLDAGEPARAALAAIQHLNQTPAGLPVIVLAGDGSAAERESAVALGAHEFVAKPIVPAELLLRVRNTLQTRRLRQELQERS